MCTILLCACVHGVKSEISLDTGSGYKMQNSVGSQCGNRIMFYTAEMITELEGTTGGVWIFGRSRSRSQYCKFEPQQDPEWTLRSVQEPNKHFKGPIRISVMMLVVIKLNGINWDVFSDQGRHMSQKCDTWWKYRVFHHYWWYQKLVPCLCKIQCVSDNSLRPGI